MLRKIAQTLAAFIPLAMSATAQADHGWWEDDNSDVQYRQASDRSYRNDGYVYADVTDVKPVYRYVQVRVPQQECWNEQVQDRGHRRHNDTVVSTVTGGVIGGAIGRQFGDGDGRDAMTILGALVGSAIANDNRRNNHYRARPAVRTVERCTTRYTSREERRLDGYHVTYVYAGRRYATRTPNDPGDRIRVRVAVTPAKTGRY